MSEPILKVEGVQAKYGDFVAVEEATLDVPQGIIVSVIGACVCIWAGRKLFK